MVLDSSHYLNGADNITAIEIVSRQFLYALHLCHSTTIEVLDPKPHTLPVTQLEPKPPMAEDTIHATDWPPTQQRWVLSQKDRSAAR